MKVKNVLFGAVLLAASSIANAGLIMIDSFETDQGPVFATAGMTVTSSVTGAGILGGERDVVLHNFSPEIRAGQTELLVSFGELTFSAGSRVNAEFEIQWDGLDNSGDINTSGLGGVDFTSIEVMSFVTSVLFTDADGLFDVTFWTNKGVNGDDSYEADTILLSIPEVVEPRDAFFLASETALQGVNFADVGAIRVRGNVADEGVRVKSYDLTIDQVAAVEVSEPAMSSMFGFGLMAMAFLAIRRKTHIEKI